MRATVTAPRAGASTRARDYLRRLAPEFGKFLGVGVAAYVVDLALFNLMYYATGTSTLAAKAIAMIVSASVAFAGNRFWTWRYRPRLALHREYSRFFVFNVIGLAINLVWVVGYEWANALWPQVFDNPLALNFVVNVMGVGTASLFRFFAYRRWVFAQE